MAKVYLDDTTLTGIANQTRRLKSSQETYKPSEMVTALSTVPIPSVPTGTINITQNGTTDVTDYATANVNVQPNLQNKQVSITTNTTTTVQKDTGYDGLGTVEVTTNVQPNLQSKSVTITENGTQTVTPDTGKDGLSSVEITTNVSGGGGELEEKDVNFYDYDGTLLHSYTKTEFLALTAMPENPTHTGLVAQGWNWNLTDAKAHVTDYDELDIGQVYTTASGLSEFDIELTAATGLEVTLLMDGTKNWGDGTTDTNTSHTYLREGKYTITCNGSSITAGGLFGNSSSSRQYHIKNIRITNVNTIPNNTFRYLYNTGTIIMSNDVQNIGETNNGPVFYYSDFKFIVFPKLINFLQDSLFYYNQLLEKICIGKNTRWENYNTKMFQGCINLKRIFINDNSNKITANALSNCISLQKIYIPSQIGTIDSNAFSATYNIKTYNFSKHSSIPTLSNTNAFSNISKLAKIIVPDSLYNNWITASNWTTYANYIIKESDYNAS